MNGIDMCLYRLCKNKSAWIILCLTLMITVANLLDNDMGNTLYERFIISINNGNWTLMFVFVAGHLVNSFIKKEYLKNLVGIIPSKNLCYCFSATISMYIGVVALLNSIVAICCKLFGVVDTKFGIGKEELIYLFFSVFQICVISLAVIIIALVTKSTMVAIIFGVIWSAYFQDSIAMYIKKVTSYYQIVEITLILISCIFINFIWSKKREVY